VFSVLAPHDHPAYQVEARVGLVAPMPTGKAAGATGSRSWANWLDRVDDPRHHGLVKAAAANRKPASTRWAVVQLPDELRRNIQLLSSECDWQVRTRAGVTSFAPGEAWRRQEAQLLSVECLAGGGRPSGPAGFVQLASLSYQDKFLAGLDRSAIDNEVERLSGLKNIGAVVALFRLLVTTSTSDVLASQIEHYFGNVLQVYDTASSLYLIRLHGPLTHRYSAVRALLAAEVAPESLRVAAEDFKGFNSAKCVLNAAAAGAWPYLAPALLSLSPYVTGVLASRAHADLVWLFGQPLAGRIHPTDELLTALEASADRFLKPYGPSGQPRPTATGSDAAEFLRWCTSRMNCLLSVVTDLTLFVDGTGRYDARRHTALLLSIERVFRDLLDVLTGTGRNEGARLRAAYHALDCLHGMRIGLLDGMKVATFRDLTTPSKAERGLERLAELLPPAAAAVCLPKCRNAVSALNQIRAGFFLDRHVASDGLVDIPDHNGLRNIPWDRAIPDYLRIDRNSAHSFLEEINPDTNPGKLTTFIAHDGALPPGLADLPYLWLLLLVAEPDRLRTPLLRGMERLARQSASSSGIS
jgi:hypothetical protein